eukprot:1160423-Pelagomonas_calceolata.AAC.5
MQQHSAFAYPRQGAGSVKNLKVCSNQPFLAWTSSMHGNNRKTMEAEETLPTSIKEKEGHRLKRAEKPLHHTAGTKRASGTWRVAGSTWLQNLAARSILCYACLVGTSVWAFFTECAWSLLASLLARWWSRPKLFQLVPEGVNLKELGPPPCLGQSKQLSSRDACAHAAKRIPAYVASPTKAWEALPSQAYNISFSQHSCTHCPSAPAGHAARKSLCPASHHPTIAGCPPQHPAVKLPAACCHSCCCHCC